MICENCKGTGKVKIKGKSKTCFTCDGSGEMCDVCGEATNEPGMNICEECSEEEKDAKDQR